MFLKLFVGVVAALGLGFTAIHFSDCQSCSGGGCPLSRMLSGGTSDVKTDTKCDNPGGDCCTKEQATPISTDAPKGGCCVKGGACCDTPVSTKASCCKPGAACCEPAQACCAESKVKACPLCGGGK